MPFMFRIVVLLLAIYIPITEAATLSVDMNPGGSIDSSTSVSKGSLFDVNIVIQDVNDLAAFQFDMSFNGSLLSVESITSGNVFGADTFPVLSDIFTHSISFAETTVGSGINITTPVILATLHLKALAVGTTGLDLSAIVLGDSLAAAIALTDQNNGQAHITDSVAAVPLPPALALMLVGMLPIFKLRHRVGIAH